MKSIWGVDHRVVAKSYIPGKGWVPAVQAGKRALRGAKGAHKAARGVTPKDAAFRSAMKEMTPQVKYQLGGRDTGKRMNLGRGNQAERWESDVMPGGMEAFAYMKGKRRIMVTKPGADPRFVRHEAAHLSPKKRTAHRLSRMQQDPARAMREEARADMAGGMPFRGAPKTTSEARRNMREGKQYSGYAAAARGRGQARAQRKQGLVVDTNSRVSRKMGLIDENSPRSNRRGMFTQSSLGEYRTVQDKIDAGRGIRHKDTAAKINFRNRAKDVAYPAAGVAAVGGGTYAYNRNKKRPGSQSR